MRSPVDPSRVGDDPGVSPEANRQTAKIAKESATLHGILKHSPRVAIVHDSGMYIDFTKPISVIQILATCIRNHQIHLYRQSYGGLNLIGLKHTLSFLNLSQNR